MGARYKRELVDIYSRLLDDPEMILIVCCYPHESPGIFVLKVGNSCKSISWLTIRDMCRIIPKNYFKSIRCDELIVFDDEPSRRKETFFAWVIISFGGIKKPMVSRNSFSESWIRDRGGKAPYILIKR